MTFCTLIGTYRWIVAITKRTRVVAPFWTKTMAPKIWILTSQKTTSLIDCSLVWFDTHVRI